MPPRTPSSVPSSVLSAALAIALTAAACERDTETPAPPAPGALGQADPAPALGAEPRELPPGAALEPAARGEAGAPAAQPPPPSSPKSPKSDRAPDYATDDPEDDVRQLSAALEREELGPELRGELAKLLGTYRRPESVDALIALADEDDPQLVLGAVEGLKESRDPRARATLRDLRSHPNADVRAAAEEALAERE